ncbi:MAG: glycosyltransferase [Pseudomonas sp.]|uniref:glycosyltransferase family 2 protein n=1 Tax=Pseudomonas abieticivorans TaxID=2931382 RepID=UPI0020C1870B|nr:glycosyltransferase [Pseudomonas sp. PIA16]MDE1166971.1 glycosyltransferase [Pseudomonas sp.]
MSSRTESEIMQAWGSSREPLLSIACPTYNHEGYIAQTLDSFLAQETTFPFEVLVNDDASTDGTAAIVADYGRRYPNIIKPILQPVNQYQKGNHPCPDLFRKGSGKYLAFCEGDDFWTDPLKLQKQVDFLEAHHDYVITYHDAMAFDSEGPKGIQLVGEGQRDASSLELMRGRPISTLTVCFRNVLHELPLELVRAPLNDLVWWALLGAYGKGKYLADIQPAAYRVHLGGVFSMRSDKKKLQMTLHTYSSLANYYFRIGNQALYEHCLVQVFCLSLSAISPWQKLTALAQMGRNIAANLLRRLSASVSRG